MFKQLSRIAVAALCVAGLFLVFPMAVAVHAAAADTLSAGLGSTAILFGMTTLAADVIRNFEIPEFNDYGVIASDIIYEGALVGDDGNGYARPLVAGDKVFGFAVDQADNSAGAAGAIDVHVRTQGRAVLAISGAAITDVGKPVYASDDAVFTFTQGTNSHVGRMVRYVSSGIGVVAFNFDRALGGSLTTLYSASTETNTGGTIPVPSVLTFSGTDNARTTAAIIDRINSLIRYVKGGT